MKKIFLAIAILVMTPSSHAQTVKIMGEEVVEIANLLLHHRTQRRRGPLHLVAALDLLFTHLLFAGEIDHRASAGTGRYGRSYLN